MTRVRVEELMTRHPIALPSVAPIRSAAEQMKKAGVGAITVEEGGVLRGILTDRDIVVRCLAEGWDPDKTAVGAICSNEPATLAPEDSLEHAVNLMRARAIRRAPVVSQGKLVGILSLGDLARDRDPTSVLASISQAAPGF
jgi:CBS domain-containing protein